jgi:hypothetical protein
MTEIAHWTLGKHVKNITGQQFGRLLVVGFVGIKNRHAFWHCACSCGKTTTVISSSLVKGNTRSCGCMVKDYLNSKRKLADDFGWQGKKVGRMTIKECVYSPVIEARIKSKWLCVCSCGKTAIRTGISILNGINGKSILSCGCVKEDNKTHGRTKSREYRIWRNMHSRCKRPNLKSYASYGGRGIKVCERWGKFVNFYADVGPCPSPNHSLDRINNDGDYEPSNCRWATGSQQMLNQRDKKSRLGIRGITYEEKNNRYSAYFSRKDLGVKKRRWFAKLEDAIAFRAELVRQYGGVVQ